MEFCHIRGDGGDGGLEGYWKMSDGSEIGYQAKYHPVPQNIDWRTLTNSILSSLNSHPLLRRVIVSMPRDLTDYVPGRFGKSEREKWNELCESCKSKASEKGIDLEIEFWREATLENLLAKPQSVGLRNYWFGEQELTEQWFRDHQAKSRVALDERYSPEDHVHVDASRVFHGLLRSAEWWDGAKRTFDNLGRCIKPPMSKKAEPFLSYFKVLEAQLAVLTTRASDWNVLPKDPIEYDWWKNNVDYLNEASDKLYRAIYNEIHGDEDRRKLGDIISDAQKIQSAVATFSERIFGPEFEADSKRIALFEGEAGTGKSHLIGAEIENALAENSPSLLILGSHLNAHSQIENQIQTILGISSSFVDFLDTLNACAEARKTRAIICIDAINESNAPTEIRAFLQRVGPELQKRTSLSLAISCRSEYTKFYVPSELKPSYMHRWIEGFTEEDELEEAAKVYMDRRGIRRPATPWLSKEFTNPLFLRSVCNSLAADNQTAFPLGLRGISAIFSLFIKAVSRTLVTEYYGTDELSTPVMRLVRNISEKMASDQRDFVSKCFAQQCVEQCFIGKNCNSSWLEALQRGGVLRFDPDPRQVGNDPMSPPDDIVRFSFQRFQDYLLARALLNRESLSEKDFKNGGDLNFLFHEHGIDYHWIGVFNALWTVAAEKFHVEIYDVLPKKILALPTMNHHISEAYIESINWRDIDSFSDRTEEILTSFNSDEKIISILLNFAVLDHPWNIAFLDSNLRAWSLPQRDRIWTIAINSQGRRDRPQSFRFVSWCLTPTFKQVSVDVARLALNTLTWFFTSTNKALRDTATKAAIEILLYRPALQAEYLKSFADINDPYVVERVLAASAGACLRDPQPDRLKDSADAILDAYVAPSNIPIHVLSRDYLQSILDLASDLLEQKKYAAIKPPYGSEAPCLKLPIGRVEKLAERMGASSILSSCNVERHGYGDFGRYVLRSRLDDISSVKLQKQRPSAAKQNGNTVHDLPVDQLASWVIFNTLRLGWRKSRFPRDASQQGNRIQGAKIERIGKKYQWIAYYELLARLADNYWLKDSYREPYAFPYETTRDLSFIRDIEITLPATPKHDGTEDIFMCSELSETPISKVDYDDRAQWVFKPKLATTRIIQCSTDSPQTECNLYRSAKSSIDYSHGNARHMHDTYQEEWFYTWMIGVPRVNLLHFVEQAERLELDFHAWLPRQHTDVGYVYELGRRRTWQIDDMRVEHGNYPDAQEFSFRDLVAGFLWEGHLDASVTGSTSVFLPSPWLADQLKLIQCPITPGLFEDGSGESLVGATKMSHAEQLTVVRQRVLAVLNQNDLSPLWIGFGERSVYPEGDDMQGCTRTRWNALLWEDDSGQRIKEWADNR